MNPIDLILKSVANALIQDGVNTAMAQRYSKDAADHYRSAARFSSKGAYSDCLAYARKLAKQGGGR